MSHGIGGLYSRLYAGDVASFVLVDPAHKDMPTYAHSGMPREEWTDWMRNRRQPNTDSVVEADVGVQARGFRTPGIPVTVLAAAPRCDRTAEGGTRGCSTRPLVRYTPRYYGASPLPGTFRRH